MYNRLEIEQSILGAIIYYNGYSQIAHILSASNFSSHSKGFNRNRELFSIVREMYPSKPIDFLSIAYEINVKHHNNPDIMQTLYKTGEKVCGSASIVYWAFILLQIDLSVKFRNQLIEWKTKRESNMDHAESGALKEIIENIIPSADIFEIIDGANRYFKHLNMQEELAESLIFYEQLSQKIRNVKTINSIQVALSYLFKISEASPQVRYECESFAKAIAIMINTNTSKPLFTEAANLLST